MLTKEPSKFWKLSALSIFITLLCIICYLEGIQKPWIITKIVQKSISKWVIRIIV